MDWTLLADDHVLAEWPLRVLRFPVGLYRRLSPFRDGRDRR